MVETTVDVLRPPSITLSQAELDDIEAKIAAGQLPPDFLDRHFDAVEANVFGADHKKDKQGNPIEQGIGSSGNQTRNSINAFKRYGRYEDGMTDEIYAATVKRLEAELAASEEVRAAAAPARRRRRGR